MWALYLPGQSGYFPHAARCRPVGRSVFLLLGYVYIYSHLNCSPNLKQHERGCGAVQQRAGQMRVWQQFRQQPSFNMEAWSPSYLLRRDLNLGLLYANYLLWKLVRSSISAKNRRKRLLSKWKNIYGDLFDYYDFERPPSALMTVVFSCCHFFQILFNIPPLVIEP